MTHQFDDSDFEMVFFYQMEDFAQEEEEEMPDEIEDLPPDEWELALPTNRAP